jgi:hypothetical protein
MNLWSRTSLPTGATACVCDVYATRDRAPTFSISKRNEVFEDMLAGYAFTTQ